MKNKKTLSRNEVKRIAYLARLVLRVNEVKKLEKQLINIFDYIDQIGLMKAEKVKETSHPFGNVNVFREDEIDTSNMLTQDESLSNASAKKSGYFRIKAIFDQS